MKTILQLIVLMSAWIYALVYVNSNKHDYSIELEQDGIHIETKHDESHIIQLDSLEEFIIKDNI